MPLHWDPPCNLSASKTRRLEESDELLALKVLYCSVKLGETSALQLIFLTETNLRTSMMRLSLGFQVFPGTVFVENRRGKQLVSVAGNEVVHVGHLLTMLQVNQAASRGPAHLSPQGHAVGLRHVGGAWMCSIRPSCFFFFFFPEIKRCISVASVLLNIDFLSAVLEGRNLPAKIIPGVFAGQMA